MIKEKLLGHNRNLLPANSEPTSVRQMGKLMAYNRPRVQSSKKR